MSSPDLPEIVYLNGVRFVRTCEPQRGEEFADAQIKALTGGAQVRITQFDPRPLRISGRDTPDSQDL